MLPLAISSHFHFLFPYLTGNFNSRCWSDFHEVGSYASYNKTWYSFIICVAAPTYTTGTVLHGLYPSFLSHLHLSLHFGMTLHFRLKEKNSMLLNAPILFFLNKVTARKHEGESFTSESTQHLYI